MLRNYNQIWSTFLVHCCNFFHGRGKLEIHELAETLLDQVKIYMMTDSPKPSQQRAWWWSSHPRTSFRAQGSLPSNRSGGRERHSTPAAGLRHQPAMSQVNRDALKFLQTALPMLGAVHWGLAERRKTKSWVPRGPCSLVSTQSCGKGLQTHRKNCWFPWLFYCPFWFPATSVTEGQQWWQVTVRERMRMTTKIVIIINECLLWVTWCTTASNPSSPLSFQWVS
jgi:hypothetical protein